MKGFYPTGASRVKFTQYGKLGEVHCYENRNGRLCRLTDRGCLIHAAKHYDPRFYRTKILRTYEKQKGAYVKNPNDLDMGEDMKEALYMIEHDQL